MNNKNLFSRTSLLFLSLLISSPVFAAEGEKQYPTFSLTNSQPLTARSLAGYDIPIPFLKEEATIGDVKTHVAAAWNHKYETTYTEDNIHLVGPGHYVGQALDIMAYNDGDMILRDALIKYPNRLMHVVIKTSAEKSSIVFAAEEEKQYVTSSITASNPLMVRSMGGYDIPVPFLKEGATIWDVKTQVAEAWNHKYEKEYTEKDIHLVGPGSYVGQALDVMAYQDEHKIFFEAIKSDEQRLMHVVIRPSAEKSSMESQNKHG